MESPWKFKIFPRPPASAHAAAKCERFGPPDGPFSRLKNYGVGDLGADLRRGVTGGEVLPGP